MTSINGTFDVARLEELNAFDERKSGVKGLVDEGIQKIPSIFIRSEKDVSCDYPTAAPEESFSVPVLSLGFKSEAQRRGIIDRIRAASKTVGFFQMVDHGVPTTVMKEMLEGVQGSFELPKEEKMKLYRRDSNITVKYVSNFDLYTTGFAHRRDTLVVMMHPKRSDPHKLPLVCRYKIVDYSKHIDKLETTLFELLSEALGLDMNYLKELGCSEGHTLNCHYYPQCPQPDLTMGISKHTDPCFITILLQDQIGGLQVLYKNKYWVNVPPMDGAFVVNIGDLL